MSFYKDAEMDFFGACNEFYKGNPPSMVLDDLAVRHINEIPLPGKYELSPCSCGVKHKVESDTWFHSTMKITQDTIAIYRACKECREILMRKLTTAVPT